jgi:hypothetical protein
VKEQLAEVGIKVDARVVPDDVFFEHLANRRFPSGQFIRKPHELDYLEEPDVFHDVFGHVPLLSDPVFADYMHEYGKAGWKAMRYNRLKALGALYWYTVEFGLIQEPGGLRIYGAGILSGPREAVFALEAQSPNRIMLNDKQMGYIRHAPPAYQDMSSAQRRTILSYIPGPKLRDVKKLLRQHISGSGFALHEQEAVIDQFMIEFVLQAADEHGGLVDLNEAMNLIEELDVCTKEHRRKYKNKYKTKNRKWKAGITAIQKIACEHMHDD